MNPGQMQFTRMAFGPYSTAATRVIAMTPALAAEYTPVNGEPLSPPTEEKLMIVPRAPDSSSTRIPCLVPSSTPRRSTSMTRS